MKSAEMVMDFSITHQLVCEETEADLYEGTRQWLEGDDSIFVKRFGLAVICFSGLYFMGQVFRILFN
ncbi:hypothetical protein [Desulfotomaculum sp. 1211_IL3151]|uniref:hypothetical protein n=1 Tax=Desulfotomaculum sp. 1211_IL3151 TaxID=3084055 RepID=UPI002FDA8561